MLAIGQPKQVRSFADWHRIDDQFRLVETRAKIRDKRKRPERSMAPGPCLAGGMVCFNFPGRGQKFSEKKKRPGARMAPGPCLVVRPTGFEPVQFLFCIMKSIYKTA